LIQLAEPHRDAARGSQRGFELRRAAGGVFVVSRLVARDVVAQAECERQILKKPPGLMFKGKGLKGLGFMF
jgi:hypothetical protein